MFKLFFRMVDIHIVGPLNQQLNSKKQKHNQYIYDLPSKHVCTNSGVFVIFKQMKCFRCFSLKTE